MLKSNAKLHAQITDVLKQLLLLETMRNSGLDAGLERSRSKSLLNYKACGSHSLLAQSTSHGSCKD